MPFDQCPPEAALVAYANESCASNNQRRKAYNHLQGCSGCRDLVSGFKDASGGEVSGLIEEIFASGRELSPGTLRLFSSLKEKIGRGQRLKPEEREKVEGIYAFMCRS